MKQFNRFKQFADKAFVRPEHRCELMSDDLVEAEKHIELMKLTCETTVKKMQAFIQLPNQNKEGATIARKIKKVPEYALGTSLDELGKKFEDSSVLGIILGEAGKIEMTIGTQMMAHEGRLEPILGGIQKLVDNDFPNVSKLKRQLIKMSENMDTAKAKLQQANRHSMSTSTGGRIDNFKDEVDESQVKVEQSRDNLASEMYQLLARETDIAQSIVQFLRCQQEYHHVIAKTLSDLLPEVEAVLANASNKPVFGTDLVEHITSTQRIIAYPLELCVCGLLETALTEEGLFRIAGSASKVKKLKAAMNAGLIDLKGLISEFSDPHVIGNVLKCYLRELPNPLLTFELYQVWIDAIRLSDTQEKLQAIWNVVQKLPSGNRENLRYLIKFLRKLSDHQDVNKMSSANIAIVLGPNLLWSAPSGDELQGEIGLNMAMTHWFSSIVEQLVTYADWFFPDEIEFFITWEKPEPEWVPANLSNMLPLTSSSVGHSVLNGNNSGDGGEDILDDNPLKRSQSTTSLDENSGGTQNGSPKPVIRRKIKHAPLPPSNVTQKPSNSEVTATHKIPHPSKIGGSGETAKPMGLSKREGMWIPPSPSQLGITRNSLLLQSSQNQPQTINHSSPSKVVPPKPPQPNFLKDRFPSASNSSQQDPTPVPLANSALRHKTSFRSPSKAGSTEHGDDNTPLSSQQFSSASLPRHFHTENSYKNSNKVKGSPPDVSKVKSEEAQQVNSNLPSGNSAKSIETKELVKSELRPKEQVVQTPQKPPQPTQLIGFEGIERDLLKQNKVEPKAVPPHHLPGILNPANNVTNNEPVSVMRPVPAPRASLLRDSTPTELKPGLGAGGANQRPELKAKPRDLQAKRLPGEMNPSVSSHSRNSSGGGSGLESDGGETISDGRSNSGASSSQPQSRSHSRTDSTGDVERKISGDGTGTSEGLKEGRTSIPSEDEIGDHSIITSKIHQKTPNPRPPRPQPPPPPNKTRLGESTDM